MLSSRCADTLTYSSTEHSGILKKQSGLKILLAIQDNHLRHQINAFFTLQGFDVLEAHGNCALVIDKVHKTQPRILILESPWDNNEDTLDIAIKIREEDKRFPIILVTTQGSEALAVSALRAGLKDYFSSPLPLQAFTETVNRCFINERLETSYKKRQLPTTRYASDQLIGESVPMRKVKTYLQKLALVNSHVLITGETGTGKELTAQYIHQHSARCTKPFIAINCAAIPDGLLESELFGHEKGAFTGAHTHYAGKLKLADGGTVFLDEIGDMSAYAQAKILRALESREVYPLGAKHSVPIDIRVIAATNCDLENMILKKDFRQDLYFRLNVARVQLPTLRERKEDIPCLAEYYVRIFNERFGKEHPGFTDGAWELLLNYDWPGNIRELKNVLEANYIDLDFGRITEKNLPNVIRAQRLREKQPSAEYELLLSALRSVHWNKSKAADKLNWSRMKLYRMMAKYNISSP